MTDPFRFLNNILSGKAPIMNTDEDEKDYAPFLINRGLSQHIDCLLYANEMNQLHHLSNRQQYDYLFRVIRKMKRPFAKWPKAAKSEYAELVMKVYKVNHKKALQYLKILNKEQLAELKEKYGEA